MMKQRSWAALIVCALTLTGSGSGDQIEITAGEILDHIKTLASDEMEGRRAGTAGDRKAARYLTRAFRSYGLDPVGQGRYSLRSRFTFTAGVELARGNALRIVTSGESTDLRLGKDFRPLGFSASGQVEGELVFVGYGIEAAQLGYDDYDPVDVKGKVVLALFYSPDGTNLTENSALTHRPGTRR